MSRPLAVFDVDGVLADVRHRLHHLERHPKHWQAFFAAAVDDPALSTGVALVCESARDCEVVYVTGRPERCRADTRAWFTAHGLPAGTLAMRRPDDHRPGSVAKLALLREIAADRVVAVVVDDDAEVCAAYEQAGFTVLWATWMGEQPALHRAQREDGRT